jgi:hypothetical protein
MFNSRRQLHAASIDYDGCYGHGRHSKGKSRIAFNPYLLAKLRQNPHPKILLVGSNRQDYYCDKSNADRHQNGSCFEEMVELEAYLQSQQVDAKLAKLLLADIDSGEEPGFSFDRALQKNAANIQHPTWVRAWDNSKLRILYAQMHFLASENPDADIEYDFFDDRSGMLQELLEIFQQFPELKPGNVKLNLYHYKGLAEPTLLGSCDYSKQPTDAYWQNNVRLLGSDKYCIGMDTGRRVNRLLIPDFISACQLKVLSDHLEQKNDDQAEKDMLQQASTLQHSGNYKDAIKQYASINVASLSDQDKEQYYDDYAACALEINRLNPLIKNSEYNTVEAYKEKIKLEYASKMRQFSLERAVEIYATIDPAQLSKLDHERYYNDYELASGHNQRPTYASPPAILQSKSLSPRELPKNEIHCITGFSFKGIIGDYQSKSLLGCCGLFARSGTMTALRKLQNKEWITISDIENAICTDKKGERRVALFRGGGLVDNSGTEDVIKKLSKAYGLS